MANESTMSGVTESVDDVPPETAVHVVPLVDFSHLYSRSVVSDVVPRISSAFRERLEGWSFLNWLPLTAYALATTNDVPLETRENVITISTGNVSLSTGSR